MDAVNERHIDAGEGTPEAQWLDWLDAQPLLRMEAHHLVRPGERAVVVAPHPDDEVLTVGGLLAQCVAHGRPVAVVAVTDGEASHPDSIQWSRAQLAQQRSRETQAALACLGSDAMPMRARLPDGEVAAHTGRLADLLHGLLTPRDVVFTTWHLDGHPDHEATARTTRAVADAVGARLFEVPVWGWHWARAGHPQMPWGRATVVPLPPQALQRKLDAVQAFATQWERDPSCAGTPVLRPSTLQRVQRPFELVFA